MTQATEHVPLLNNFSPLSTRELEVMRWAAEGKTSYEIGIILGLTERTVNFHVAKAIFKLNASNKTHAAVKAAVLGLIVISQPALYPA